MRSAAVLAVAGCRAPPGIEGVSVKEGVVGLFSGFDGSAEALAARVLALEAAVDGLGLPEGAPMEERTFSLSEGLGPEALGGAVAPDGTSPEDQVAVVVFKEGRQPFEAVLTTALEPNQVCIEGDSTVWYGRTYSGDRDAFEAGRTDLLRSTNEVRKELWIGRLMVAGGWYDLPKDLRRLTLDDGRRTLLARSWQEEVVWDERGNRYAQLFTLELWVEDGEGTRRTSATWAELHVPFVTPAFLAQLLRNNAEQGLDRQDAFPDGDLAYCGNDRERAYDRGE